MSVKQRPRPRAFRPPGPNRPEQILAAASRAIQQRGFANTRIADIASEAGMSTGAIHYYFDVKDEVLIAALKWASERLFDRLDELLAAAGSERERLAREELSKRWRDYFYDPVRRGAESGEFEPVCEPDEVAERLIALVDGLGFELLLGYSWTSPERMRERVDAFVSEQLGVSRSGRGCARARSPRSGCAPSCPRALRRTATRAPAAARRRCCSRPGRAHSTRSPR